MSQKNAICDYDQNGDPLFLAALSEILVLNKASSLVISMISRRLISHSQTEVIVKFEYSRDMKGGLISSLPLVTFNEPALLQ